MADFVMHYIRRFFRRFGYEIVDTIPPDFDAETRAIVERVKPFTMTSQERIFSLCKSVEYVVEHDIPGDIVECGVWKGGSMMAVAQTLIRKGAKRRLYLFDTFEGMSEPTAADTDYQGNVAANLLENADKATQNIWAYSDLDTVKRNIANTGYDEADVIFVKGKVEDTIPLNAPDQISLLRLDTDWYESTIHELRHLYPRLSVGGVLIIDDYGHWTGAKKAVDEYIKGNNLKILLNRIDYTGRVCVKLNA